MENWPLSLPTFVAVEGYSEKPKTNLSRFKPEVGRDKRRRRTSIASSELTVTLPPLTAAQVEILDEFYRVTLAEGALEFRRPHPRTEASEVFTMDEPTISAIDGYWWRVSIPMTKIF